MAALFAASPSLLKALIHAYLHVCLHIGGGAEEYRFGLDDDKTWEDPQQVRAMCEAAFRAAGLGNLPKLGRTLL